MNQSIIIEFNYGINSLEPLFALEDALRKLVEKENVGTVDGHEIAIDDSDGRIYMYSNDARRLLEVIEPVFSQYHFLRGAKVFLRFGKEADATTQEKVINDKGKIESLEITDMRSLSPFPEWDNERYRDDEGDEWKTGLKNERAKKLYNQWQQVYLLVEALCDGLKTVSESEDDPFELDEEDLQHSKEMILGDGMIIPAKIVGAEAGNLYVLRMENAAIIRKAADDTYKQCSSFRTMGVSTDAELDAVRAEINIFRQYFKEWVAGFERDDWEDEWGLF